MECLNCGSYVDKAARYCSNCGIPQQQGVNAYSSDWETCQISCRHVDNAVFSNHRLRFEAYSIGPRGTDTIASPEFESWSNDISQNNPGAKSAFNDLLQRLHSSGWEDTGRLSEWYEYTLRRRIRR